MSDEVTQAYLNWKTRCFGEEADLSLYEGITEFFTPMEIPVDLHFHIFQTTEGLQIERVSSIPSSFLMTRTPEEEKQLALLDYLSSPEFEEDINEGVLEIHERYGQLMLEMVQAN